MGIGARNLKECLVIQLNEMGKEDSLPKTILENHYEDLTNKRYEKLINNLKVSVDEIKLAIEEISKLNPKPGEGYINANENYIIPDLIVEKVGNELIASVNDTNVPQLRINNTYRRMLTDGANISTETKKYIHQKIESARWLINSYRQIQITMLKVLKESD